ncbi:cobalamin biosynthesis protein CobD [Clostridiales bacterium]|nr:cobalamin biosynthesis protein CobD [Clostridiales bacterium]
MFILVLAGFLLDFIFGDPNFRFHPIRLIGRLITFLEKIVRRLFPKNKWGEILGGALLVIIVCATSFFLVYFILKAVSGVSLYLGFILESLFCWFFIAAKSLRTESMKVYNELKNSLESARRAVSMIVGRDTQSLDEEGVIKAAVETVAENTSDGVIAPLFFMFIGGAPLGCLYKAINTMDSMIGYKNETYIYFGKIAARLDDIVNFIPSRLSAVFMLFASFLLKLDWKNAIKIFKRDRLKHKSPNSAQTESVCAGALDIRLAGDAWYFGRLYKKDFIGDALNEIVPDHIILANRLMYVSSVLALIIFTGIIILGGF